MKKLTHLSILTCAFSCLTAYSVPLQTDEDSDDEIAQEFEDEDLIDDVDEPSTTLVQRDGKNILIVQNAQILMHNVKKTSNEVEVYDIQPERSPTPPSMIILGLAAEPYFSVDYLFWTARQDNMEFVYQQRSSGGSVIGKSKVKAPDWKYDSGFRIGAGLDFKHDGWDTYLNYTWFHPEKSKRNVSIGVPSSAVNRLIATWSASADTVFLPTFFQNSKGSWKFHYDDLVWELGRNFYISRFLTLRPFGGLETSWQKQKQELFYEQPNFPNRRQFFMRNTLDYWGIGIRVGLNSAWYLYKKNLSIIGDVAFAGLWSHIKTNQKQRSIKQASAVSVVTQTIPLALHNSFHSIKPVIDWMLGMQWESWFYNNRMKLLVRAAWEEQVWINQNALPEVFFQQSYNARGGDLSIEGLTIRARFDF